MSEPDPLLDLVRLLPASEDQCMAPDDLPGSPHTHACLAAAAPQQQLQPTDCLVQGAAGCAASHCVGADTLLQVGSSAALRAEPLAAPSQPPLAAQPSPHSGAAGGLPADAPAAAGPHLGDGMWEGEQCSRAAAGSGAAGSTPPGTPRQPAAVDAGAEAPQPGQDPEREAAVEQLELNDGPLWCEGEAGASQGAATATQPLEQPPQLEALQQRMDARLAALLERLLHQLQQEGEPAV